MIKQLIILVRVLTIIGLISLAVSSVYFKFGDCDKVKITINNTEYSAQEFMQLWADTCMKKNEQPIDFKPGKLRIP